MILTCESLWVYCLLIFIERYDIDSRVSVGKHCLLNIMILTHESVGIMFIERYDIDSRVSVGILFIERYDIDS